MEESNDKEKTLLIRDLFLGDGPRSESKKVISVKVPESGPEESEINQSFEAIFDDICTQIQDAIKAPSYADCMINNFPTTSTSKHTIASQINLMESLQEFFDFEISYELCGLKGIEMIGTVEDWELLKRKLHEIRKLLDPIMESADIGVCLPPEWWSCVEMVFDNLILTMKEPNRSGPFWRSILMESEPEIDGNPYSKERMKEYRDRQKFGAYDGWLVRFLFGSQDTINEKHFKTVVMGRGYRVNELSGVCKAPLTVSLEWCDPVITEKVALIGGIIGFHCHENNTMNGVPSLQPHHMWAMVVDPSSNLRNLKDVIAAKNEGKGVDTVSTE